MRILWTATCSAKRASTITLAHTREAQIREARRTRSSKKPIIKAVHRAKSWSKWFNLFSWLEDNDKLLQSYWKI